MLSHILAKITKLKNSQRGFFSIITIMLVVVIALLASTVAYMFAGSAISVGNLNTSAQAFYLAESGLETAANALYTPNLANRISCINITNNASTTNVQLAGGRYTVTTPNISAINSTALNANISASVTSIPVSNASLLAPFGRIMIDKEIIYYGGTSSNNLVGVMRGVDGSLASSHTTNTSVSQFQCNLTSAGGYPDLTTSSSSVHTLTQGIQLPIAIIVGNRVNNNLIIVSWNTPTALTWTSIGPNVGTNRISLNSISLTSYTDGWAVGQAVSGNFGIYHWDGNSWTNNTIAGSRDLIGVHAVSAQQVWTVGLNGTILRGNGSNWSIVTSPTTQQLNAVSVLDTNGDGLGDIGWAVGNTGTIIRFINATTWNTATSPTGQNLNHVVTVSTNNAWAVGNSGVLIRWNGSSWATVSSPTTQTIQYIAMQDTNGDGIADYGWLVGNSGACAYYNGSTWTNTSVPGNPNLRAVAFLNNKEAWAVSSTGGIYRWNGSTWSAVTSPVTSQLNDIAIVGPTKSPVSGWQEVFS